MRILSVHFKNLNSLTGEWHIDFTHPAYASDGLFAITGPTGSGKTTILDAICLGLYGRTPRLEKVTKSGNEIMSRQTGECFAEVAFETQKGRYLCHWSQHRTRKSPDGELQQAKHEIADADSGRVLESSITQVGEFIEKSTGMDFERFTRSMLLAQGGFAVFLQATPNERAPILEQITGTEIYSRISMKVYQRRIEENEILEKLQAELKGIHVLREDETKYLLACVDKNRFREKELGIQYEGLRKAAIWLDAVTALEKEIHELDQKQQDFELRRKAFEQDARKLEKSRKALGLEGDYREVKALRTQQCEEVKELGDAIAAKSGMEKARSDALMIRQAAESVLSEARTGLTSGAGTIKQVRELDARLSERKKQIVDKTQAIETIGTQAKSYKVQIENGEKALKSTHTALKAIHEYLAKHTADAALPATLPLIKSDFELLRTMNARHEQACKAVSSAVRERELALETFRKTDADYEDSRRKFEIGQTDLKRLNDEITDILKGREISQWRNDMETAKDRERLLNQTLETTERIGKAHKALIDLGKKLEALKADHVKLLADIRSGTDKKMLLEKDIASFETQVLLLGRIRGLEEERKRLEDGQPCPLCGATNHPYAEGNIPELNHAEKMLNDTRGAFKIVDEKTGKLEARRAGVEADIQHGEKEMVDKRASLDADKNYCTDIFSKLNIKGDPDGHQDLLRKELAVLQADVSELSRIVKAADEKNKEEKESLAALEKIRLKFDLAGKALLDARHKMETAGLGYDRLSGECASLAFETQKAHAAALGDVKPFGMRMISLGSLDAVLKDLTGRKDAWQEKEKEKTAREKEIAELKADIDKYQALLGSLDKDLSERREDLNKLNEEYEILGASRRELFGEKNADHEERNLAAAADQAGKAFEKAREQCAQNEKAVGMLNENIHSLQAKTNHRAKQIVEAEQLLLEQIKMAGFQDEADYRLSRLGDEEQEILAKKEQTLIQEKTSLDARQQNRLELLAIERKKSLTDQSMEVLKEKISACDLELKQVIFDIGAISKSLNDNEKLKEEQQKRMQNIESRRKECARWAALHQLIGSADGKKFRNFAQGLTFEMMTAHANRQLRKMTDRYLLIRDASQPLELNVIDNYQAGEIRSTKNLSGGESFIVSLALALGLSQMASRNVRVDSLFLDEGFGTLDDDALETAMETLADLRQDGKLIGIISHVTALRERISAQIQVIPGTGGRSSLTGPGCRRGNI